MEKKSFIIYDNWACLMSNLPVEKAGELIQAICNYKLTGEINIMDPSVNAMFVMIKEQLDVDADNYQKTCEKRKESGSKGGKQKVANAKQKVAKGSNCKQNVADNDTDTDNDTDNDNDNKRKSAERILEMYHTQCPSLPKVMKLTGARIKAVNARLKEYSEDDIETAFIKAENSPFLRGEKSEWKASFDWIMKPNNMPKILEGNYDDREQIKKDSFDSMLDDWAKGENNGET